MTPAERAFGWLVLGDGMTFAEAAQVVANAPIGAIEIWARRQRRAVLGFYRLLSEAMSHDPR